MERCKEVDDDDDDEEGVDGGQVSDEDSASSGSSDSEDGSEKCPICLQRFTEQEVGSPEMCEHQFCLRCITAWSKVSILHEFNSFLSWNIVIV